MYVTAKLIWDLHFNFPLRSEIHWQFITTWQGVEFNLYQTYYHLQTVWQSFQIWEQKLMSTLAEKFLKRYTSKKITLVLSLYWQSYLLLCLICWGNTVRQLNKASVFSTYGGVWPLECAIHYSITVYKIILTIDHNTLSMHFRYDFTFLGKYNSIFLFCFCFLHSCLLQI